MRLLIAFLTAFFGFAFAALAQTPSVVSDGPGEMSVTIYPNNLAMITERRTITLPAGRSRIVFEGVNDQIIPQTALLTEFGAMSIERNFDYDLLTPTALFENVVGEEVTLIRTSLATGDVQVERATVISGAKGVVFRIGDRTEAYQCSGLAERIEFDGRPEQLQAKPALSLTVEAEEAREQTIEFRYLATGFEWRADYILSLNGRSNAGLNAWLTISNNTGIGVEDADLSVVSGTLSQLPETVANGRSPISAVDFRFNSQGYIPLPHFTSRVANCIPQASPTWQYRDDGFGAQFDTITVTASRRSEVSLFARVGDVVAEREDIGDYKLYRAPFATTLAARQTKQIAFLNKPRVKYSKLYVFDFTDAVRGDILRDYPYGDDGEVLHSEPRYVIDNSRQGRLAEPLPAGIVRVMDKRQNDDPFFAGEDQIYNLPIGLPVEIDVGFTGDVVMMRETHSKERVEDPSRSGLHLYNEEYIFFNTTGKRVTVELGILLELEEQIIESSIEPVEQTPSKTWQFNVPANGSRSMTLKFLR